MASKNNKPLFLLVEKHLLIFYCVVTLGYYALGVNSKQGMMPGSQSAERDKQVS